MLLISLLFLLSFFAISSENTQYQRVIARYIDHEQANNDWKKLFNHFDSSWNYNLRNHLRKNPDLLPVLQKYKDLNCEPSFVTTLSPMVPLFFLCCTAYVRYNFNSVFYINLSDGILFISLLFALRMANHKEKLLHRKNEIQLFLENPSGLEGPTYEIEGIVPNGYYITYVLQNGLLNPNSKSTTWKRPSLGHIGNV